MRDPDLEAIPNRLFFRNLQQHYVTANRGCCRPEGAKTTKQFSVLVPMVNQKVDCDYQNGAKNHTKQITDANHSGPEQTPLILKVKRPPPESGNLKLYSTRMGNWVPQTSC